MTNSIKTIVLALTLTTTAAAQAHTNDTLDQVADCNADGSMALTDSGWLIDAAGNKVDFHDLMARAWLHGVPDALYAGAETAKATIQVCRMENQLHYFLAK